MKKFDVKRLNPKKLITLILIGNKLKKVDVSPYKILELKSVIIASICIMEMIDNGRN